MPFEVQRFPLGPLDTNCYLVSSGGEAVVIDAGGDPDAVVKAVRRDNLKLTHILNTHLHCDHTYGNAALQRIFGLDVLAGAEEAALLESDLGRGGAFGLPKVEPYQYKPLAPGGISLLGTECIVLSTPGHTPGSLSFYFPEHGHVFTGDVLFLRSVGRTDFPGGSAKVLRRSIKEVLFALPDNTTAWPGHGEETNIGDEKMNNPCYGQFARI